MFRLTDRCGRRGQPRGEKFSRGKIFYRGDVGFSYGQKLRQNPAAFRAKPGETETQPGVSKNFELSGPDPIFVAAKKTTLSAKADRAVLERG